jgi:hypothetical protein
MDNYCRVEDRNEKRFGGAVGAASSFHGSKKVPATYYHYQSQHDKTQHNRFPKDNGRKQQ